MNGAKSRNTLSNFWTGSTLPDKLRSYLDSLLVSDVAKTGIDNRFELNIAITAIERFIVGHVGQVYPFPAGLKEALFKYEDSVVARSW